LREGAVAGRRRVVVFHCNWAGRRALDEVGRRRDVYSCDVIPVQVSCLGRMHTGLVLKALESGAAGVLMLGCPEGECRFGCDGDRMAKVHAEASRLAELLGFGREQVRLERVQPQDGEALLRLLDAFASADAGVRDEPVACGGDEGDARR